MRGYTIKVQVTQVSPEVRKQIDKAIEDTGRSSLAVVYLKSPVYNDGEHVGWIEVWEGVEEQALGFSQFQQGPSVGTYSAPEAPGSAGLAQ